MHIFNPKSKVDFISSGQITLYFPKDRYTRVGNYLKPDKAGSYLEAVIGGVFSAKAKDGSIIRIEFGNKKLIKSGESLYISEVSRACRLNPIETSLDTISEKTKEKKDPTVDVVTLIGLVYGDGFLSVAEKESITSLENIHDIVKKKIDELYKPEKLEVIDVIDVDEVQKSDNKNIHAAKDTPLESTKNIGEGLTTKGEQAVPIDIDEVPVGGAFHMRHPKRVLYDVPFLRKEKLIEEHLKKRAAYAKSEFDHAKSESDHLKKLLSEISGGEKVSEIGSELRSSDVTSSFPTSKEDERERNEEQDEDEASTLETVSKEHKNQGTTPLKIDERKHENQGTIPTHLKIVQNEYEMLCKKGMLRQRTSLKWYEKSINDLYVRSRSNTGKNQPTFEEVEKVINKRIEELDKKMKLYAAILSKHVPSGTSKQKEDNSVKGSNRLFSKDKNDQRAVFK